ncbi:hypothetical protein C8F01DRAFT_1255932 [Mycena amicta]|nr:hypothetical protein C8F01DRAFT_1255932 [Mycena amicta]
MSSAIPPALRLKALEKIPLSTRRTASAAVEGSITGMALVVEQCSKSSTVALDYLPVVFALLDPRRIPSPDVFGPLRLATNNPHNLYRALWPRIWSWMQFFELYSELRGSSGYTITCGKLARSIAHMSDSRRLVELVRSTPGAIKFFARLWASLVHQPASPDRVYGLTAVYEFLGPGYVGWNALQSQQLVEGIDVVDWRIDLGSYVLKHIVSFSQSSEDRDRTQLVGLISICQGLVSRSKQQVSNRGDDMLNRGLIATLAKTLCVVSTQDDDKVVDLILCVLYGAFTIPQKFCDYLAEAVHAGLLDAAFALAQNNDMGEIQDRLEVLICDILRPAMVYHSVVQAAQKARLPDMHQTYFNEEMGEHCSNLARLVREQSRLLIFYQSAAYQTKRMCSNPACFKVVPETMLRRCSIRLHAFFCNKDCQRSALELEHRVTCVALYDEGEHPVKKRVDHFLRVMLHRDYRANKLKILLLTLEFVHRRTPGQPVIVFDYSRGRGSAELRVIPSNPLPGQDYGNPAPGRDQTLVYGSLFHLWVPSGPSAKYVVGLHHAVLSHGVPAQGTHTVDQHIQLDYILCSQKAVELYAALRSIAARLSRTARVGNIRTTHPQLYTELVRLNEQQWDEVYR